MAEDPAGARQESADLLGEAKSPAGQVRLYGLQVLAYRRLGNLEAALDAYDKGRKLRGSALARSELEGQAAELHCVRGDLDAARNAVGLAIELIRPLALTPRGKSKGAKRKARYVHSMYAAALTVRAEIARNLEGDPASLKRALADVLEALHWVDPRYASRRVHLSATSVLALLVTRVGNPADVGIALKLAEEADKLLRRRRIPARHPHRAKLRGIRGLALARLGVTGEKAERMLFRAVKDLRKLGLDDDADRAAADLLWVIGERSGQHGRARYLRRALGLPPAMDPPEPPRLDEVDPPIGF